MVMDVVGLAVCSWCLVLVQSGVVGDTVSWW